MAVESAGILGSTDDDEGGRRSPSRPSRERTTVIRDRGLPVDDTPESAVLGSGNGNGGNDHASLVPPFPEEERKVYCFLVPDAGYDEHGVFAGREPDFIRVHAGRTTRDPQVDTLSLEARDEDLRRLADPYGTGAVVYLSVCDKHGLPVKCGGKQFDLKPLPLERRPKREDVPVAPPPAPVAQVPSEPSLPKEALDILSGLRAEVASLKTQLEFSKGSGSSGENAAIKALETMATNLASQNQALITSLSQPRETDNRSENVLLKHLAEQNKVLLEGMTKAKPEGGADMKTMLETFGGMAKLFSEIGGAGGGSPESPWVTGAKLLSDKIGDFASMYAEGQRAKAAQAQAQAAAAAANRPMKPANARVVPPAAPGQAAPATPGAPAGPQHDPPPSARLFENGKPGNPRRRSARAPEETDEDATQQEGSEGGGEVTEATADPLSSLDAAIKDAAKTPRDIAQAFIDLVNAGAIKRKTADKFVNANPAALKMWLPVIDHSEWGDEPHFSRVREAFALVRAALAAHAAKPQGGA